MPAYVTVSVSGIGLTANEDDVRTYFEDRLPGCEPVVSRLTRDLYNATKVTTVTFKRKSKQACRKAVHKLKDDNIDMRGADGFSSSLGFSQSFLDLTVLSGRSMNPSFDVYFVHGLGGSAFKSFASKSRDHKNIKMWARDFLPDTLDDHSLGNGRYMTFGYPAPIIDSDRIVQSIKDTAQNLLREIVRERGDNCTRPMFFICHSLGGLVVSQALLLLLREHSKGSELSDFQSAICPSGDCLIKGITFFGTPFRGSSLANLLAMISSWLRLPVNKSHIMSLRIKDEDVTKIVDEFEERTSELKIPLLAFYELLPEKLAVFKHLIVKRDSANGRFGDQVRSIGLLASHRGMAKFKSSQERLYDKNVAPAIQRLTHTALRDHQKKTLGPHKTPGPPKIPVPKPAIISLPPVMEESRGATRKVQELVKGGLAYDQHDIDVDFRLPALSDQELTFLRDLVKELQFNFDILQGDRKERINVSPAACQWLFKKPEYQEFINSTHNTVLFIEGGPGYGKSSLAKFLTVELGKQKGFSNGVPPENASNLNSVPSQHHSKEAIIAEFFSRKEGRDNSPKAIIMHILHQIRLQSSEIFLAAAKSMYNNFTQQRDLKFYWTLFTKVRRSLTTNLVCIIDGLDECIRQHRPERVTAVDQKMVKFLNRLCGIEDETSLGSSLATTKVLLTTRFEPEVVEATTGRRVLRILNSDIADSVKMVVKEEVSKLVADRDVSSEGQEFIVEEVTRRCETVFLKAINAVKTLKTPRSLDLNSSTAVKSVLETFNFEKYNDVYARVLERIHPHDQELAAKIIRILFFTLSYLDMNDMQHALAVYKQNPTVKDLESPPSKDSISHLIRTSLGSLVNSKADGTLDLEHQSIYDFLRKQSYKDLHIYSCHNRQEGNLHLALICIRYLLLWRHQKISEEEITAAGGHGITAAFQKSHFVTYAARNWQTHAREAGELIKPHIALVDKLLGITSMIESDGDGLIDYRCMAITQQKEPESYEEEEPNIPSPIQFLCSHNMVYLLSVFLQPHPKFRKRGFWKVFSKQNPDHQHPFNLDATDGLGRTPLHHACEKGYLEIARLLLKGGAEGSIADKEGYTPFAHALNEGHKPVAELLIECGKAVNGGETSRELQCIHYAAYNGITTVLRSLLAQKMDPNLAMSEGWTPVHLAAQEGHIESLELLLDAGGLPEQTSPKGVTPLHCAAQNGHLHIVKLLFQRYPNINPSARTTAGSAAPGSTPLNAAARLGHLNVFNYMKEKESPPIPNENGDLPIHSASIYGHISIVSQYRESADLSVKNKDGRVPMHLAALNDHLNICKYLKEHAPEAEPDSYGYLPIHLAASNGHFSIVELFPANSQINGLTKASTLPIHLAARGGHLETFKWLKDHGSDNIPDDDGYLPIHMAASNGHSAILREFQGSSDIHLATNKGWLPIHLVAFEGDVESAKALKELGAIIDEPSKEETPKTSGTRSFPYTALQIAIDHEHSALAMHLIDEGASIDTLGPSEERLIERAAQSGLKDVFLYLAEHGQDPWRRGEEDMTSLHVAASEGKVEIIKEFIRLSKASSVTIDPESSSGLTPLEIALEKGHVETAELLISAGADVQHQTQYGQNTLMFVMGHDTESLLPKLIEGKADVNARDSFVNLTAIHFAANRKRASACALLISHKADINTQSVEGRTPLREGASSHSPECVKLLLENGADPSLRDQYGRTIFDEMKGSPEISKLLEPHIQKYQPLPQHEMDEMTRASLKRHLTSLPEFPIAQGMEQQKFSVAMWLLANCLFHLGDYDRARSCVEIRAMGHSWFGRELQYTCDLCWKDESWPAFWSCKQCPRLAGMCTKCYTDRTEEKIMPGCSMGHEYFEIGGTEWAKILEPERVDNKGCTAEQFVAELKSTYCTE